MVGKPALPTFSHPPIGLAYLHPLGHKQRPYPFSASSVKCRVATKREALGLCVGCGHLLLFTADCLGCGEGQTTPHPPPLPRHRPSTPLHRWARRLREARALLRSQSGLPFQSLPRKMMAEQPRPPPDLASTLGTSSFISALHTLTCPGRNRLRWARGPQPHTPQGWSSPRT